MSRNEPEEDGACFGRWQDVQRLFPARDPYDLDRLRAQYRKLTGFGSWQDVCQLLPASIVDRYELKGLRAIVSHLRRRLAETKARGGDAA